MTKKYFDALVVINSDTDLEKLNQTLTGKGFKKVFILSSNYLYPYERQVFENTPNCLFHFSSFLDYLDDNSMMVCDRKAHDRALPYDSTFHIRYFNELIDEKNSIIFSEIEKEYTFDTIYFEGSPYQRFNLGISYNFWSKKENSSRISRYSISYFKGIVRWYIESKYLYKLFNSVYYLFKPLKIHSLNYSSQYFIFLSINRIKFKPDIEISKQLIYTPWKFILKVGSFDRSKLFMKFIRDNFEGDIAISVPLHEFPLFYKYLNDTSQSLLIFEDAFRPSNYPPYYFVNALYHGDFVVRDMFDFSLFSSARRKVIKPFTFLKRNFLKVPNKKDGIKTDNLILSLNHAGDWSSMLNRADTDYLIYEFTKLAMIHTSKIFIIRAHPTSVLPRHEGANTLSRIKKHVIDCGLPNLELSTKTLEEDWTRGDIFISEYSLSAIDAMQQGKLAFFVNLTNRRSFVEDYKKLGFLHVEGAPDLERFLENLFESPGKYYKRQVEAISNYNDLYSTFLSKD